MNSNNKIIGNKDNKHKLIMKAIYEYYMDNFKSVHNLSLYDRELELVKKIQETKTIEDIKIKKRTRK